MALTVQQAKSAKPRDSSYKVSDEKGMYLLIHTNGSKYWRMDYRLGGKRKTYALGVFPEVSLADARDDRNEARKLIRKGIDPSQSKRLDKLALSGADTFKSVALEWYDNKMTGKSDRHRQRAMSILKYDLFPKLGGHPINDISAPELLAALRKIESRGASDIAHRAKSTAGQIFRYAIASGMCERDVSADLKGALKDKPKTEHRAAITEPRDLGRLMIAIDGYEGTPVVCAALKISALLFQRPGEIRQMEWSEIKWEDELWSIPGGKMKMGRDHIVPLSTQAIEILKDIYLITGAGKFVFPSQRGPSRPLSDNGVRTALRTMGYENKAMTPHGFRATARTILDEIHHVRVDYIEHQQARAVRDTNGRAYNRTKFLPERKQMMQQWADYLDELRVHVDNDNIVPLRKV
jgi:integrase